MFNFERFILLMHYVFLDLMVVPDFVEKKKLKTASNAGF